MWPRKHFTPVIVLGLYGVIASVLLLIPYLDYSAIMQVSIPLLSTILFTLILALGVIGLMAGRNQIINKTSTLTILILSTIGGGGGIYLLYMMLYVLETICFLCISLNVTLWMIMAYTFSKICR